VPDPILWVIHGNAPVTIQIQWRRAGSG